MVLNKVIPLIKPLLNEGHSHRQCKYLEWIWGKSPQGKQIRPDLVLEWFKRSND